ncbi:MAG TPA: hypothetical protein PKM50_06375 [Methanoregula sp.]|nr:hypothetical protein [Methanoregula sp.]
MMRRSIVFVIVGFFCLMLMTGAVMAKSGDNGKPVWLPGLTSGNGVVPLNVTGNPTCADVCGSSCTQLKIEDGQYNGMYYLNSNQTWWVNVESFKAAGCDDKCAINWTSNFDVMCVIMKGGDGADVYTYSGSVRSDTHLSTPINSKNDKPSGISHVIFCYDSSKLPPVDKPVPEFPLFFIPVAGIIGLAGLALFVMRK